MYKVAFFDVDGTLLSEIDRSIHESTKEAIQKLIEKERADFVTKKSSEGGILFALEKFNVI